MYLQRVVLATLIGGIAESQQATSQLFANLFEDSDGDEDVEADDDDLVYISN